MTKSVAIINQKDKEEKLPDCDLLGNNTTTIDWIFFISIIAFIIIAIIGIIYLYVQFNIKQVKRFENNWKNFYLKKNYVCFFSYLKKVNYENELTTEISQLTNRFN